VDLIFCCRNYGAAASALPLAMFLAGALAMYVSAALE
jgi:hypothetical protein